MSNLKKTIEDLAADFAVSIIGALRSASIDELTSVGGGRPVRAVRPTPVARPAAAPVEPAKRARGGRLGRRSATDIGRVVDNIVALLESKPEGLRAEQIREALGVQAKELPRPLADGLREGRLTKTGQKRATTYFVAEGGAAAGAPKRRGGRGGRRKAG